MYIYVYISMYMYTRTRIHAHAPTPFFDPTEIANIELTFRWVVELLWEM